MITHDQCQAWESEVNHLREKLGEALEENKLLKHENEALRLTLQTYREVPHVTE